MKTFPLSDPKERAVGAAFTAIILVVFALLLYGVRNQIGLLIFCALCVVLIGGLLVFYIISVAKAKAIWDPETKVLEVKGFPSFRTDLSNAVLMQTMARKSGQVTNRVIIFSDAEERIITTIPTYFTAKQGLMAEPFAKAMAEEMGIPFQQNVPEWEYNKEKYQEHIKEVEAQEKVEAKARREAKMKKRIEKRRQKLNEK